MKVVTLLLCSNNSCIADWGSGLPNGLGNDWTMLDPAIVTGQLSNSLDQAQPGHGAQPHTSHTADSPPSWITANLEQLTAEPGRSDIIS